jgi:phage recombination protein Bet
MSTDIAPYTGEFNQRQIDVMRKTVAAGTSPEDFALFLEVCKHRRLNPFAREIYAIVRSGKMTIQVSIDGFRKLAERSGKYRGQLGPQFCGEDGVWKDEWLKKTPPVAAKVGVLRADFDQPVWAVARYEAYVQPSSPTWQKMPDIMVAKCAEALALRKAFPDEMSGLYTHEEMTQAGKPDVPLPSVRQYQPESAVVETTAVEGEVSQNPKPEQAEDMSDIPSVKDLQKRCSTIFGVGFWQAMLHKVFRELTDDVTMRDDDFTPEDRQKVKAYMDYAEQAKGNKPAA